MKTSCLLQRTSALASFGFSHLFKRAPYLLLIVAGTVMAFLGPQAPNSVSRRALTFAERVSYQRAIEEVYWRHRIWPVENRGAKPALAAVMSQAQLEQEVENYLLDSQAVEKFAKAPLRPAQLQAEMERMASQSKQPAVLRDLFQALGNDPYVIAECLARTVLTERMTRALGVTRSKTGSSEPEVKLIPVMAAATTNYTLPKVADEGNGCTDDTWVATSVTNAPGARINQTAVWTGTEMIIWGGDANNTAFDTGGRYNPSTDSWTPTNTVSAPDARSQHTAVWTGTEMIVWGGNDYKGADFTYLNTGGRYNPSTDSWVATTAINAPDGRDHHTAVWTGAEMIVWGGLQNSVLNTGGRYNPNSDSWTETSATGAPSARYQHTAVWSGSEMIVWGGSDNSSVNYFNTGARYDPMTDIWQATTTSNAPTGRSGHATVWSGFEMVVWGGGSNIVIGSTGGRYDPFTDSWTATSTVNAPSARFGLTFVWTGSDMIVWGGFFNNHFFNTGGRYNPFTDNWTATSTVNTPSKRGNHAAVWTGNQMIVWGGFDSAGSFQYFNTGGRYCAEIGPTPSPTPVPITLQGQGTKVREKNTVSLTWSGANSAELDVYRDGGVIATTANDGLYVDSIGNGNQADYTYKVCEAGSQTCSNEVVVTFLQTINATWSTNPVSGDWNNPLNWTPPTVPDGPFARAIFNTSSITNVSLSGAIAVNDIVFKAGASAFTITTPVQKTLTLSGAGVLNSSGQEQNFVTSGTITLQNSATAGSKVFYTCSGTTHFYNSSSAGKSTFVFSGAGVAQGGGGADFRDSSSAADATIIVEAGTVAGASGGGIAFDDGQVSVGDATIIANGATVAGAHGGSVAFFAILPSEPTIIGNGGVNGGTGAVFTFFQDIPGNRAHFQLNGDALLDISISGGVTIGSLAGDGTVDLGDFTLETGGNDQNTLFSGVLKQINTEGGDAGLRKVGSGTLRLSHNNKFKNGGVTIAGGTVAIDNQIGSATGSGGVGVQEGTLAGGGTTAGAVEIGTGSGQGAFLAPGQGAGAGKALTIQHALIFKADGAYTWKVNTRKATADQVSANGVTIAKGAQFDFAVVANHALAAGTTFTALSNTSGAPIIGTFANLPDGSAFTSGRNTFQVSYTGGDGNDLTLTVVP